VFVDGRIGDVTLDALSKYLRWRGSEGESVMVTALNCTQGVRYLEIAEKDPTQEEFLYGWVRARVKTEA
jgi:typhoid toxin secretion A